MPKTPKAHRISSSRCKDEILCAEGGAMDCHSPASDLELLPDGSKDLRVSINGESLEFLEKIERLALEGGITDVNDVCRRLNRILDSAQLGDASAFPEMGGKAYFRAIENVILMSGITGVDDGCKRLNDILDISMRGIADARQAS
jgi:hypothetical protein